MDIAVEISLYPLSEHFGPAVHEFIGRLQAQPDLKVVSGSLGTQVVGEYDRVFAVLQQEMRTAFAARAVEGGKAVVVMKVLGPL